MMRTLCLLFVLLPASAWAQTHVASGGNLQTAITNAVCNETITLEAGATFTGNFTLPSKGCSSTTPVTIRTVTSDGTLGTSGITASNRATFATLMATIATGNATAAMRTTTSASHWRFVGLIFQNTTSVDVDIVQFGDGVISSLASLPTGFVVDQCIFTTTGQAHRGLAFNAADVTVRRSHFYGIRLTGTESHALSCYNCPGAYLIEDNYIEAGSIGLIFGGAAPAISGLVPTGIVVRRNTFTRNAAWISDTGFLIKNLFELKNAQDVHVYGNLIENNWDDSQAGYPVVLTVRANSPTGAPQSTIQRVLFENNIIRNACAVFNILGQDTSDLSTQMEDVTIRNNLIYGISRDTWNGPAGGLGSGRFLNIDRAPKRLTVEFNTVQGAVTGSIIFFSGTALESFVLRNNILPKQTTAAGFPYATDGIIGQATAEGNASLNAFTTSGLVTLNVLAGATAATYNSYGPGNLFPSIATLEADYTNAAGGNFRLVGGSAYAGIGMNQDAIEAAQSLTDATSPKRLRRNIIRRRGALPPPVDTLAYGPVLP